MIKEKLKFTCEELPELEEEIQDDQISLNSLLIEEEVLSHIISKSDSFEYLQSIIDELNQKHLIKGEFENSIQMIDDTAKQISSIDLELENIGQYLFSNEFEECIKEQLKKFNLIFSQVSDTLYGEVYAITHEIKEVNGNKSYEFTAFEAKI